MNALVLGIGQSLRGDDAVGVEAVQLWQTQHPQSAGGVKVETIDLPGLHLLDLLEGMNVAILVDAIKVSSSPGTIIQIGPDELAAFTLDSRSAHGWGVAETLQLGRTLYPSLAKCRISLIGIAGKEYAMGTGLSQEVKAALITVVELIERKIQES
jgi:hydrogenase maturation protease